MTGLWRGPLPVCPRDQNCSKWAQIYMKYCLCSVRDGASLTIGLISIFSWTVAEIPQIITIYKEKSTEGLSFAFLITWVIGDLFNLFGCMLEPATLPTQYYMALMYTATTIALTGQTIYYGHIYHRLKAKKMVLPHKHPQVEKIIKTHQNDTFFGLGEKTFKGNDNQANGAGVSEDIRLPSTPIPVGSAVVPRYGSLGREVYYMSARSLSKSHTSSAGPCVAHLFEPGRTPSNQDSAEEPLLGSLASIHSAPSSNTKSMLCVVSGLLLFVGSLQPSANNMFHTVLKKPAKGMVIQIGRKLLQNNVGSPLRQGHRSNAIGSYLGWSMAAIYMGGRLPQIYLNIRRGNVEGLNPLMFIFALVGNSTYVTSILVSSLEWYKIKPNLPWLVDAGGCVLLDSFILLQFLYFSWWKPKYSENNLRSFDA